MLINEALIKEQHDPDSEPLPARVKWFNATKGYGFIQPEEGDKDVFVHITALEQAGISKLDEGQRVSFEIATNKGRENAVNIQIVE